MLAVPSKCTQLPIFVTPVPAPISYDLDYCRHLLMGLPASAQAFLRSLVNTAANVILLNCTSDVSLLPQSFLSHSEREPKASQWLGGLRLPHLSLHPRLAGLLAVPEIHEGCCQLRDCVHAVPCILMHPLTPIKFLLSLPSGSYSDVILTGRPSLITLY